MRRCDACGSVPKGAISIGGAYLCRTCAVDVRTKIDALRAAGQPTDTRKIAREIFRAENSIEGYILRDIPIDLWDRAKHRAIDEGKSLREMLLTALEAYLPAPKKP